MEGSILGMEGSISHLRGSTSFSNEPIDFVRDFSDDGDTLSLRVLRNESQMTLNYVEEMRRERRCREPGYTRTFVAVTHTPATPPCCTGPHALPHAGALGEVVDRAPEFRLASRASC